MSQRTRRLARWVVRGLAVALALVALAGLAFVWRARRAFPPVEGTLAAAGLRAPVQVLRDRWGVPHIYAQGAHDLFFAQGYVTGQDRLWQLEVTRRMARGRLAELFGERLLRFDRGVRTLGLGRAAEREWQAMDGSTRALLQAYADGVSAALAQRRAAGRLPLEYALLRFEPEPWTPLDSLACAKLMYWALSENGSFEMSRARFLARAGESVARRLLPPYSDGAPVIVPPGVDGYAFLASSGTRGLPVLWPVEPRPGPYRGSNNWVVHGTRSASGRPLLANDTHLDLFLPSTWYTLGLHGGGFEVAGESFAGLPGIVLGHNERVAWGVTDLVPDIQDLYLETLDDPGQPRRYLFRGEWRPLEVETHTVAVRGGASVTFDVRRTHHGPLVHEALSSYRDTRPLALAWAGFEGATLVRSVLALARAHDWESFRRALLDWDGAHMNFVYADVDGHIGYQAAGRIPTRAAGHGGELPVPGADGAHEWGAPIPFNELPRRFDPPEGFIATANQKVASAEYPHHLGYEFADPYRARRLEALLRADARVSLAAAQRMQADTHHLPAEALRPLFLRAQPQGELEARALAALRAWDLRCDPGGAGPSVYQALYRALVQETVGDELGQELLDEYLEYYWVHGPVMLDAAGRADDALFDDVTTRERRETRDEIATRALRRATAWLAAHAGRSVPDWDWGRLHTVRLRHRPFGLLGNPLLDRVFNYGPVPDPGCDRFTVNVAWFNVDGDEADPFSADAGVAQRLVLDLADWDAAAVSNSSGQNEAPLHPHRTDLSDAWLRHEYHALPFSRAAVESLTAARLTLVPPSPR
jgi:penicillin amidase